MSGSGKGNVPTLGGWLVTALLGAGVFILLRNVFGFVPVSAACFGLAAALLLLLLLTGGETGEVDADTRVRRIVPTPEPGFATPAAPAAPAEPAVAPVRAEALRSARPVVDTVAPEAIF